MRHHAFSPYCESCEDRVLLAPAFTIKTLSDTVVQLNWTKVSRAIGYYVEENGTGIANLSSRTTSLVVNNLAPGTRYTFDVLYYKGGFWNPETAKSVTMPASPAFTITILSDTSVKLYWGNLSRATGCWIEQNGSVIAKFNTKTTSFTVNNLTPGATYNFTVVYLKGNPPTWKAIQSVTMPNPNPPVTEIDHPTEDLTSTYTVINGTLFGPNGPLYSDVYQGSLGDCWLEASFAEVAGRDPQLIRNMFTYLGLYDENGVTVQLYDVRFYNPSGQIRTVEVDNEFPVYNGYCVNDNPNNGVL